MKKHFLLITLLALLAFNQVKAQEIDWENLDLRQVFGKVLTVKQGYAPKFFIGKNKIPKLDAVAKILGSKNNPEINRLFRTFRTGRTVYKITSYGGAALSLYGTVKTIANSNKDSIAQSGKDEAKRLLYSGAGSILSGVLVKLLTKGASYKAVDLFGGVIRRKLEDVINFDLGVVPMINNRPGLTAGIKIVL